MINIICGVSENHHDIMIEKMNAAKRVGTTLPFLEYCGETDWKAIEEQEKKHGREHLSCYYIIA